MASDIKPFGMDFRNVNCGLLNDVKLLWFFSCSQANFFITYILTSAWAGFPLEILQFGTHVLNFMKRLMVDRTKPLLSDVYSLPYYRHIPNVLMFILIGLTYSIITPLLLPFLLVYFILGYIVFRNQVCSSTSPFCVLLDLLTKLVFEVFYVIN